MAEDFVVAGFEATESTLANTYVPSIGLAQTIILVFLTLYGHLDLFSTGYSGVFYVSLLIAVVSIFILGFQMARTKNPSTLTLRLEYGEGGQARLSYQNRHNPIVKGAVTYPSTPLIQSSGRFAHRVEEAKSSMTVNFKGTGFHLEVGFPTQEEMQSIFKSTLAWKKRGGRRWIRP